MNPVDIETLSFHRLDARLGNYEDCNAEVDLDRACQLLGTDYSPEVVGWCRVDADRIAFKVAIDGGEAVWIVTIEADADVCGDRYVDKSQCVRVEVVRA